MAGLFQGLEIGKRALLATQYALQTTGHNIANVSTPGYSRQRVRISSTNPEDSPAGPIGSGVQAQNIKHIRDLFLGTQFRDARKSLGRWQSADRTLDQIEAIFNEPNTDTLSDLMNRFWDSWSELSTNADSIPLRVNVVKEAEKVVNAFHNVAQRLTALRQSLDGDVKRLLSEVNRLSSEISNLNQQVARTELGDTPANDLRDQRDLLTDELAALIDVNVHEKPDGTSMVYMGGMILVDGPVSIPVDTRQVIKDGQPTSQIVWRGTTVALQNLNGELYGVVESRDVVIANYLTELNKMSRTLVEQVNALHQSGTSYDGTPGQAFFEPTLTDAATMSLNLLVADNPSLVVASAGTASDNRIALALAGLRDKAVMTRGTESLTDFYGSLVGKLGVEAHQAKSFSSNFELLTQQIDNAREAVQGVSLDEEMAAMVKQQHAYDAAARIITAMDQALETVISNMGMVGR